MGLMFLRAVCGKRWHSSVVPFRSLRVRSNSKKIDQIGLVYNFRSADVLLLVPAKLIKGSISAKNVGGPLLIFQQAGERAKAGKSSFLFFLALISINLGIVNLLPVPILDGGHIFFSIIELVVRRKIPVKAIDVAQKVGIGILVCIMVLATFNDVMRIFHVR